MGNTNENRSQLRDALRNSGKLHQPRLFERSGIGVAVPGDFVWMDVFPTVVGDNPMIQGAWETYRVALTMAEAIPKIENYR